MKRFLNIFIRFFTFSLFLTVVSCLLRYAGVTVIDTLPYTKEMLIYDFKINLLICSVISIWTTFSSMDKGEI